MVGGHACRGYHKNEKVNLRFRDDEREKGTTMVFDFGVDRNGESGV